MCKAFRDWEAEIRKEQANVIKNKDVQLEQKDAKITDLEKENARLRAKLAANGVPDDDR